MSATKRILTESAHAISQAQKEAAASGALSGTYVTDEMSTQLQNVGRRIRQSVTQGYRGLPITSTIPSSTTQDDIGIQYFRSDADTLRSVFSSQERGLPRYCDSGTAPTFGRRWEDSNGENGPRRKRGAQNLDEQVDTEEDESDKVGGDGDGDAAMASARPIRAAPARLGTRVGGLRATHTMPASTFSFTGPAVTSSSMVTTPQTLIIKADGEAGSTQPAEGDDVDFSEFFDKPEGF